MLAPDWDNILVFSVVDNWNSWRRFSVPIQTMYVAGNPKLSQIGGIRLYFRSPGVYCLGPIFVGSWYP